MERADMATIDWHHEPQTDEERCLRAEIIQIATEDGLAALGGRGGWAWVYFELSKLCPGSEESVASDLRSAIREADERFEQERESRRVLDAERLLARAQERIAKR
jgi:hypothetical protein